MSEESLIKATEPQTEATEETPVTEEKDFVTAEDQIVRPEWLPEKFKTPEAFAESYSNLEKKFHQKEEDLRATWDAELQEKAFENRPKTADDYELPESIDKALGADNKLLGWWSKFSWDNGLSQEEFNDGIEIFKNEYLGEQVSIDDEMKKLGDNGQERVQAVELWANKFFPESALPAIEKMCESHEGIIALETMMANMKDGSFAGDTASASELNEADLRKMMDDPKYWKDRDPHLHKQVAEGFKRIYRS